MWTGSGWAKGVSGNRPRFSNADAGESRAYDRAKDRGARWEMRLAEGAER
jgi:hypothetical protein